MAATSNSGGATLTEKAIKLASGNYDLGAVFHLSLASQQITDPSAVSMCANITFLDLSHNNITSLSFTVMLAKLDCFNISYNGIADLSDLAGHPKLRHLDLRANNVTDATPLRSCPSLSTLYLQDISGDHGNPVCRSREEYLRTVCAWPQIRVIDGKRTKTPGGELYALCDSIDAKMRENTEAASKPVNIDGQSTQPTPQSSQPIDVKPMFASFDRAAETLRAAIATAADAFTPERTAVDK